MKVFDEQMSVFLTLAVSILGLMPSSSRADDIDGWCSTVRHIQKPMDVYSILSYMPFGPCQCSDSNPNVTPAATLKTLDSLGIKYSLSEFKDNSGRKLEVLDIETSYEWYNFSRSRGKCEKMRQAVNEVLQKNLLDRQEEIDGERRFAKAIRKAKKIVDDGRYDKYK